MAEIPQAVIVLRFGTRPLNGPDPANQTLAEACDQVAMKYGIRIFLEKETHRFAKSPKRTWLGEPAQGVDTVGALRLAYSRCEALGIKKIALGTGGGFHCIRAKQAAEKMGFEVVQEIVVRDVYYWGKTSHWQTWAWWLNLPYEAAARVHHKRKGWI